VATQGKGDVVRGATKDVNILASQRLSTIKTKKEGVPPPKGGVPKALLIQ